MNNGYGHSLGFTPEDASTYTRGAAIGNGWPQFTSEDASPYGEYAVGDGVGVGLADGCCSVYCTGRDHPWREGCE